VSMQQLAADIETRVGSTVAAMVGDAETIEALVESLHELAAGAGRKMRERSDTGEREHGVSRWAKTYFAGYLHGVCAAIATATGESSDDLIHRYTQEPAAR
jgi:nitrogenase molybdenum-iron protein alpha/beta subunit